MCLSYFCALVKNFDSEPTSKNRPSKVKLMSVIISQKWVGRSGKTWKFETEGQILKFKFLPAFIKWDDHPFFWCLDPFRQRKRRQKVLKGSKSCLPYVVPSFPKKDVSAWCFFFFKCMTGKGHRGRLQRSYLNVSLINAFPWTCKYPCMLCLCRVGTLVHCPPSRFLYMPKGNEGWSWLGL